MKKKRRALGILCLMLLIMLTACSLVKDPTTADVEAVLKDMSYISTIAEENKKSTYTYKVTIDECSKNISGDVATVKTTLTEKVGPMSTTTLFELVFKLKNDKKTWLIDRGKTEVTSTKQELVTAVSDTTAARLAKKYYYSVEGSTMYADQVKQAQATAPAQIVNKDDLICSIPMRIVANEGIYAKTFDAELLLHYQPGFENSEGEWIIDSASVDESSVTQEYASSYKVNIDTEALGKYIATKDEPIYVLGQTYKTRDEDVKIENVYIESFQPEGAVTINIPTTFDMVVNDDLRVTCRSTMEFHFVKEWQPYYLYGIEVVSIKGNFYGSWSGNMNGGRTYVNVDITDILNEYGYPLVQISMSDSDEDKGEYSWTAQLKEYKTRDGGYMRVEFMSWIKLPKSKDPYAYDDFIGTIENDIWTPADSWYDFELRRTGVER